MVSEPFNLKGLGTKGLRITNIPKCNISTLSAMKQGPLPNFALSGPGPFYIGIWSNHAAAGLQSQDWHDAFLGPGCQPKVGILDLLLAMFMVCLSVSLSVGHADVLWQNGWTDRDAFWHAGWGGPQSPCIKWGSGSTHGKGQFWGISSPIEKNWDCVFPSVQRHVSLNRERCTTSMACFPARMFRVHVKITLLPI